MAFHLVVIAVFAVLSFRAQAFSNTVPVVAWSSQRYASQPIYLLVNTHISSPGALGHLPHSLSPSTHATVLGDLFHGDEICEYDAIVIVDQPGVSSHISLTHPRYLHSSNSSTPRTSAPYIIIPCWLKHLSLRQPLANFPMCALHPERRCHISQNPCRTAAEQV